MVVAITFHYVFLFSGDKQSDVISVKPPVLSPSLNNINYAAIEKAFASLEFDEEALLLNANTESQLSIALEYMRSAENGDQLSRVKYLTEKQLDSIKSQEIFDLLEKLERYKKQETAYWAKAAADSSVNSSNFEPLFSLQDEIFGLEGAQQLFNEQRKMMSLMAASQAVEVGDSLIEKESEDEKRKALESLSSPIEE